MLEEEIIFEKLEKYSNNKENNNVGCNTADNLSEMNTCLQNITNAMGTLRSLQANSSFREIQSRRGPIGSLYKLIKKIVVKLCSFYVQPVCDQQSLYNEASANAIENNTQIDILLTKRIEMLSSKQIETLSAIQKDSEVSKSKFNFIENKINKIMENKINKVIEKNIILDDKLEHINKKIDIAERMLSEYNSRMEQYEGIISKIDTEAMQKVHYGNPFFNKMSYAQSGEDSIIQYILFELKIKIEDSSYLDIGANHAKDLSNTYALYEKGMRGVLVEANPELIPELKLFRRGDIILNKCISTETGNPLKFYIMNGDGLSTTDKEAAEDAIKKNNNLFIKKEIMVSPITIEEILERYFDVAPTILNIDIEGQELNILGKINFSVTRPLIIIIEMIEYSMTINQGEKNKDVLDFMEQHGYVEYAFTGINSIFVDKRVWDKKGE